jgi:hypothetical protein
MSEDSLKGEEERLKTLLRTKRAELEEAIRTNKRPWHTAEDLANACRHVSQMLSHGNAHWSDELLTLWRHTEAYYHESGYAKHAYDPIPEEP